MKYILYARKFTESEDKQMLPFQSQIDAFREFAAKEPGEKYLLEPHFSKKENFF